ncbi:MAG: fructosamine kinase family protein, partial [Bacteroidota bacterium]
WIRANPEPKSGFNESWIDFFIKERLEKQLRLAYSRELVDNNFLHKFRSLYLHLPNILINEPPSLLHGDLWSGNYLINSHGNASIIDPAVYYGNREIELAFTHLFGGFDSRFYQSYQEAWPLESGFENRMEIYNLYPLLVHVNLFGTSYLSGVLQVLKKYT